MPGFCGISGDISPKITWPVEIDKDDGSTIIREIVFKNHYVQQYCIQKIINDKLFYDDTDSFFCTDGVILNGKDLCSEFDAHKYSELMKAMYKKNGITFISRLRGDFSGVVYEKSKGIIQIFTNQIGSKTLYYFFDENRNIFIYGSGIKPILRIMRECGYATKLSELSAYFLLTFGYMLKDNTLCDTVKKVPPGTILTFDPISRSLSTERYYELKNTPYIKDTTENILKEMDRRFEEAVQKEYDKDLEYGYRHVATLSGGLDSRMNVTKGKMLGYEGTLAITFSQSNYLDEIIAKKIATDYGLDFLFYSLDNGNYLKDIEGPIIANDGQVFFAGAAHLLAMIRLLDWDSLGLVHTGMIGDLVLGSYLLEKKHSPVSDTMIAKAAYSTKLLNRIPPSVLEEITQAYETDEMFAFYERCVNGVFNGYQMIQNFSEYASPFLYQDFLEYVMRIHPKHRFNNALYREWIETYTPIAANYLWERTGVKIRSGPIRKYSHRLVKKIKREIVRDKTQISMNPFDYWYATNRNLKETFDEYFSQKIGILTNYPILQEDTSSLYRDGTTIEKTQALSLLAAVKILSLD